MVSLKQLGLQRIQKSSDGASLDGQFETVFMIEPHSKARNSLGAGTHGGRGDGEVDHKSRWTIDESDITSDITSAVGTNGIIDIKWRLSTIAARSRHSSGNCR
ncbi:hypothetical protein GQ607_016669 [Colletotrichum asianum]|uniref:Uncharacterized protein n=1 Tax=Colletotrichum asianum TaxID=702518 RepID=A0A8H3ZLJ7_9PEZI|nr:hypothetical protein GQ607_016669 [Colletotrichum asianum]